MADEIIFVHKGSSVAELGAQRTPFAEGATIFIPRDVRISLRNTGTLPLSIAYFFSKPGFEQLQRETSVREGEPAPFLSEEGRAEIRARHKWHTVYEQQ
jgi:oxalate decarboxylase/phosphoglucose isomerase-like protein (cupin superfamily)